MTQDYSLNKQTREAYADFLRSRYWDYFFTITYRSPRREPYYAMNHAWSELKNHGAVKAFIGAEPHSTGDLHLHGIVAGPVGDWKPDLALPWDMWSGLFKRFGRSKVESCNSQARVSSYCAKYVLKDRKRADHYEFFGTPFWWGVDKPE